MLSGNRMIFMLYAVTSSDWYQNISQTKQSGTILACKWSPSGGPRRTQGEGSLRASLGDPACTCIG